MFPRCFTTLQLGEALHIRPATAREAVCRHGHYCGLRPIKLANRRLLWPADDVERLLRGETLTSQTAE